MNNLRQTIKDKLIEALILKRFPADKKVVVVSDLGDEREASKETFKNKEQLKKANFKWDSNLNAWAADERNFVQAQSALNAINKKEVLINKLEDIEELVKNSDVPNKNQLSDRIKLFIDDLANATDEAAADAKLKQYLNFFSKFRSHSFINSFLIFIQNPNATKVAGFRQWEEKFHRRVKKGAKGIMIYAPMILKKKGEEEFRGEDNPEEKSITRFKPVYVFDVADTEPIDERGNVPETPQWFDDNTPNETADELTKYTEIVLKELGINLTNTDAKGKEKGYSSGDHINLTSNIAGVGRLSTLIHELAHELMHWKKTSPFYDDENIKNNNTNSLQELQAESVSYTVLRHYEIPVQHHATYLALWKANKDKIKDNMNIIIKVAKFIIERIDKVAESYQKAETQNLQEFIFENMEIIEDQPEILIMPNKQKFDLSDLSVYNSNHPVFKMVEEKFDKWFKHYTQPGAPGDYAAKYGMSDDLEDEGILSKKGAIQDAIEIIKNFIVDKDGIATWEDVINNSDFEVAFEG